MKQSRFTEEQILGVRSDRFFEVLNSNEELYYDFLAKHLGKYLELPEVKSA